MLRTSQALGSTMAMRDNAARPLSWLRGSQGRLGQLLTPLKASRCTPGGCWAPGGGGGVRHGMGGIFHARVRPQEKITLRAIRDEAKLRRHGIARYNKRWRSWAQNRVRQFQLPLPVTLTSDTALMDATYITSCVQKAAALRKHDVRLWKQYSARVLELKDQFLPEQLGYILWGYGKSSFLDGQFYSNFMPTVKQNLPQFQSHALMSLMWCAKRIKWHDSELLRLAVRHALDSVDALRPSDFIKVANCAAILGLRDQGLCAALSRVAVPKLEETFAQQFRDAVHPVAIGCMWNDEVCAYLLERFRRIFITARPNHLLKAYESAVICRVQAPQVWRSLSWEARQFYVRLSQRHVPDKGREPSPLHWDVSRHLADLGEAHRNAFRWGPFYVDIGLEELEEDERRRCVMVDTPAAFFYASNQYLPPKLLQHRMLTHLGWDVRRVRWDDWVALGPDEPKRAQFLRSLLEGTRPLGEELADRAALPADTIGEKLKAFQELRAQDGRSSQSCPDCGNSESTMKQNGLGGMACTLGSVTHHSFSTCAFQAETRSWLGL